MVLLYSSKQGWASPSSKTIQNKKFFDTEGFPKYFGTNQQQLKDTGIVSTLIYAFIFRIQKKLQTYIVLPNQNLTSKHFCSDQYKHEYKNTFQIN